MFPATRLTTFLRTPAPTTAEIPSLKLIRVIRNFLIFSVSALLSEDGVVKSEKPVMPSPLLTDMPTALLGITLWVGGTGTVHTDTGVVTLLQQHWSSLSSSHGDSVSYLASALRLNGVAASDSSASLISSLIKTPDIVVRSKTDGSYHFTELP